MNKLNLSEGMAIQEKIQIVADGHVTTPRGFVAGGLYCGLKKDNTKLDLGWIYSQVPAQAAGVYTTNLFQAPPLIVTQESLAVEGKLQGIIVNSGNANACTGDQGLRDAYHMRKEYAHQMGIADHYVAVLSTGVIGEHLDMEKVGEGISDIDPQAHDVHQFEAAILTTDTCTKHFAVQIEIDGKQISIAGAAKGSGMIHPNMATMLSFVTTDAKVEQESLARALKQVTKTTFNMITVDGDTSTNDTVLLLANGMAGNEPLSEKHKEWPLFIQGLELVCRELAKTIARDGEGATKLIEVHVQGAINEEAAQVVAKSIVGSSLVKTAVYGTDPNWGRIVCAMGYSGHDFDPNQVKVVLGSIPVVENGLPQPFSEQEATSYLENEYVQVFVELNQGEARAVAWGCDLSYDYVKINASYRT